MMGRAIAAVLALCAGTAFAHEIATPKADFVAPAPGSYRLEKIMAAPDGVVLNTDAKPRRLSGYTRGKVTVLSLMYTHCSDEKGCPMAFYALQMIQRDLEKERSARDRVRLVSLSFDPKHDTPEAMRAYGGELVGAKSAVPWHFLTTTGGQALRPILSGFGQDVSRPAKAAEDDTGDMSHVLKVFLIDRAGFVREIYSASFLMPQVVMNDIKTLLIEDGVRVD